MSSHDLWSLTKGERMEKVSLLVLSGLQVRFFFFFPHSPSTKESFPGGTTGKESTCQCSKLKRRRLNPWVKKIPWRRKWQPTPVFLPGKFHGQRSLAGCSPWGCKVSDTTEHTRTRLTFRSRFFNLSSCLVSWVKSSALSLIHSFSFKLFLV